jgi:glycosyltransferase involved in cell wall biosynthesis
VAVVLPGLDVASTIERTVRAIPRGVADDVIFVDDGSTDASVAVATRLGLTVVSHGRNMGYGAAQKTGYREALRAGADCVVMVHPDFQYKPQLVPAMAAMVVHGGYDLVLGSRMLVNGALRGGMPRWKWLANRALTLLENAVTGAGLSEYHTGYRAFSRRILQELPLAGNRNDFVFDNETLAQAVWLGFEIGEVSCPAHYFDEMQTITFLPGVRYGLGVLRTTGTFALHELGVASPLFDRSAPGLDAWTAGRRIPPGEASASSGPGPEEALWEVGE